MDVDWVCLAAVGFFLIRQKGEEYLHMHHTLHVCLHQKGGNMIESIIHFDDRQKAQRTVANVRSKEVKLQSKIK